MERCTGRYWYPDEFGFSEPSYFAAVIAPAFFVCIYNLSVREPIFVTRRHSIIIAITFLSPHIFESWNYRDIPGHPSFAHQLWTSSLRHHFRTVILFDL